MIQVVHLYQVKNIYFSKEQIIYKVQDTFLNRKQINHRMGSNWKVYWAKYSILPHAWDVCSKTPNGWLKQ